MRSRAQDPAQFAAEVGQLLRLLAENMKQLLEARQQAKRFARSSNQTTVQALDNNPLKFAPTVEDAMRIMFGARPKSYLDAVQRDRAGLRRSEDASNQNLFGDAARAEAADGGTRPAAIEKASTGDRGLARRTRLAQGAAVGHLRRALAGAHAQPEDGMLDAFMHYFAEYYDRDGNKI